jgi:ribosome-binding factor A
VSRFEASYEITVIYDSGRKLSLEAFSKTEYLGRIQSHLRDPRVKEVWITRVEKFTTDRFLPVAR